MSAASIALQASPSANAPLPAVHPRPWWAQAPMLCATSAFATGILWGRVLWNPASWWIGADIALISVAFFFLIRRRLYLALALALVALIFLGALNAQLEGIGALAIANDDRFALITDGREAQIAGHVIREGMLRRDAA